MNRKLSNKEYLRSYITGLFEAVGTINIPKNKKYPKLYFSFHKNNKALAEAIRERIGYGAIYEKKTAYSYEIFNKEGIERFIEITKKYYRTPKINKYNEMIEYMNKYKNYNMILSILDNSSFDSNAWLSGYLETVGCFQISIVSKNTNFRYSNEFCVAHRKVDKENNTYEPFMLSLAKYLNSSLQEKKYLKKKYII